MSKRKLKPGVILVISDDQSAVDDIKMAFGICMPETSVITAGTSQDTCELISKLEPELFILDLDGRYIECFDILSDIRQNSKAPLITMSYNRDEQLLIKALERGADSHINKPLHQLELIAFVRACLRRKRMAFEQLQRN